MLRRTKKRMEMMQDYMLLYSTKLILYVEQEEQLVQVLEFMIVL